MSDNGDWERTTKSKPCTVCGKPDWCTRSRETGHTCCMRVESARPMKNGGYFHRTNESYVTVPLVRRSREIGKVTDFQWLTETYCKTATKAKVTSLAKELGLTFDAIRLMRTGYDGKAFTMPMYALNGTVTGIQRRYPDGTKITEGKAGFFMPSNLNGENPQWITEGWSDTTAVCGLGLPVVGLYNVGWSPEKTIELLAGRAAIVVVDNDGYAEKGKIGGRMRTARFIKVLRKARVELRVVHPPHAYKDIRHWLQNGATKKDVDSMAEEHK